jgi:hypothetical protein
LAPFGAPAIGTPIAPLQRMLDPLFAIASIAFFAAACAYVVACDRM